MTIDDFGASLDIVSGKSSASFKPVFKNRFEASALACNNGVSYAVNLANDLTYDLFGVKQGDIWKYKSGDLVSGCKQLGGSPIKTQTASSTSMTSTTGSVEAASTSSMSAATGFTAIIEQNTATSKPSSTPTTGATDNTEGKGVVARRQATPESNNTNPVVPDLTLDDGYANGTSAYNESDYLSNADYDEMLKQAGAEDGDKDNTDGSVYVQLRDETGQYLLSTDASGTFNLVPADAADADKTLVSYDNVTTEDVEGRLFHYFPDTMKAFGVSRFRLAGTEDWPRTANVIALAPVNYGELADTPGVYVAADTQGNFFYTIVCNIQGRPSKVFLVDDPSEKRLESLKTQKDLQWTVVGGVVEECFPIAFMSKGPGL
ncbi:uncharacterized protein PG998_005054 [Apiospora kogelbergensis]|uniref:uncharacterized protein n=1 Tax=Apiospora kogelbergensis TaxID=1337665 RepID=UPI00312CEE49